MKIDNKYNIKAVSLITGISVHTIRAWERRYSALTPERTDTNRRLYAEFEIEKLSLLAEAIKKGHTISNIANYSIDELKELIGKKSETQITKDFQIENSFVPLIDKSIIFIKGFDKDGFEKILMNVSINYSRQKMLTGFIIPLLHEIGDLWSKGEFRIIHEHFATAIIRTFLGNLINSNSNSKDSPKMITTTLEGFTHELGALIAAIYAIDFGWNTIFLGANLSAEEISAAIKENNASAVLISMVYPNDNPYAGSQLIKLRKYIGNNLTVILTGHAAPSYKIFIEEIGASLIYNLSELSNILEGIRK